MPTTSSPEKGKAKKVKVSFSPRKTTGRRKATDPASDYISKKADIAQKELDAKVAMQERELVDRKEERTCKMAPWTLRKFGWKWERKSVVVAPMLTSVSRTISCGLPKQFWLPRKHLTSHSSFYT